MTDQQHKQDPFIKQQCTSIFRERRPMRLPSELNTITAFAIALFCFFPASGAADDPKSQPFPQPPGKKGLQVQMVDDAIALGIHHAGININLIALFQTVADDNTVRFAHGGREWLINGAYAASLDNQIRPLSEKGIVVYVILLAYPSGEAARDTVMLHPSASGEFTIAGFNTASDDGLRSYRALIAFLAERYSGLHAEHGRVWGWIVGNEVNSQKIWYNLGSMPMNEAAAEYEKAVRATHDSVREHSDHGRCYLSFDHFWAARMPGVSEQESYPTREFLMEFARISRERVDFEWHIAHHPYRVSCFSNQHEALVALRLRADDFNVVVTDYNMPGMQGLEVAREVRAIRADLPVAVTSGFIDEELQQGAKESGVRQLISKPFAIEDFYLLMETL